MHIHMFKVQYNGWISLDNQVLDIGVGCLDAGWVLRTDYRTLVDCGFQCGSIGKFAFWYQARQVWMSRELVLRTEYGIRNNDNSLHLHLQVPTSSLPSHLNKHGIMHACTLRKRSIQLYHMNSMVRNWILSICHPLHERAAALPWENQNKPLGPF